MQGWGGVAHAGVGWVMQGWGKSCRTRVGHAGIWGGSYRGGMGHVGMGYSGSY